MLQITRSGMVSRVPDCDAAPVVTRAGAPIWVNARIAPSASCASSASTVSLLDERWRVDSCYICRVGRYCIWLSRLPIRNCGIRHKRDTSVFVAWVPWSFWMAVQRRHILPYLPQNKQRVLDIFNVSSDEHVWYFRCWVPAHYAMKAMKGNRW